MRLSDLVFLPCPRTIRTAEGSFTPLPGTPIILAGDPAPLLPIALRVQEAIQRFWGIGCGIHAGETIARQGPRILLALVPGHLPQGYALRIAREAVEIAASDLAGLFYGVATLAQALRQCAGALPAGEIADFPDFPTRGVMLDISRDKVPTMETLYSLVDLFAELKCNHLELYTEHTFAYSGHPEVWAESSPMTGEEILRLDAYCRERFVDLVPNQNSFGHLQRWLTLPRYRHLAECPEGFDWPGEGRSSEPFSLDPSNPGCISLLEELYAELLPHFASRLFNVGCDETIDLGQGKSRELCAQRGRGRVYLDFLLQIHKRVKSFGRTMLFWGDIIMEHPALVPELPRDAIAIEWGYEAGHPFAEHCARFAETGIPFWISPGTSSWNSIAGRTENCLGNLRSAAESGLSHGAAGFLVTDWGDNGHWQALPVSFLGFSAGAALSWCFTSNRDCDFVRELDTHVFRDNARVVGRCAHDLGNTYLRAGHLMRNESLLNSILRRPELAKLPASVTAAELEGARSHIENTAASLGSARMDRPDARLILDEYANTVRLLLHSCDRGLAISSGTLDDPRTVGLLEKDLHIILGEYRRLWMQRNRIGGLKDSIRRLENLLPSKVSK